MNVQFAIWMVSWGLQPSGSYNKVFKSKRSEMAAILFHRKICHNIPALPKKYIYLEN